jgi:hypothetical protein
MKECQWRRRFSILLTDAEERKHREQTGLDTLVVYAVKYECYCWEIFWHTANALNTPPGKYDRKIGTQRN